MHTKVVYQGAKGLARIGCAVLRFNFRGVGRSAGAFDNGEGEADDFRAALDYMARRYPGLPLWAAGFSFGAWVALETGAVDDRVAALIGIAPPVATSVSGMSYTFPNTLASTKPKFFVQGEADEVCPLEGMWAFYGTARGAEGAGRDRRAPITCSRARRRRSARRSKTCSATFADGTQP